MAQFLYDLDPTDGNNTTIDGQDIAEGNLPATINNALRALSGSLARALHAQTGEKVSAGTANAQTLTTGLTWTAYENIWLAFEAGATLTNTGAMTLNIDGIGVRSVKLNDGGDPWAGAVTAGGVYLISYDVTADTFILWNPWIDKADFAASSQTLGWHGNFRGTVANGTYTIVQSAEHAGTIDTTITQSGAGTCTATFRIGGVNLGGTANSVSSSEQSRSHVSANVYAAGDKIDVVITAASSCTNMGFTIERTETMD